MLFRVQDEEHHIQVVEDAVPEAREHGARLQVLQERRARGQGHPRLRKAPHRVRHHQRGDALERGRPLKRLARG